VLALGTVMIGHSYKALLGAAPSSGAVPARPVIGSSTDVPHSWWTLIPDGAGEVLAVALIGLCGVGVLTVSYSAYRLINRRP